METLPALLTLSAVMCYTGQNFFNKCYTNAYQGPGETIGSLFSLVYGLVVGVITLGLGGFRFAPDGATWLLGSCNGVALVLFNRAMIGAGRRGPFTFQSMIAAFSGIIVPMAGLYLLYGDAIAPIRLVGIALMLAAMVGYNAQGLSFSGVKKGYGAYLVLLFIANGAYGLLNAVQQRVESNALHTEMILVTFWVSAVLSGGLLLCEKKSPLRQVFRAGKRAWAFALLSSVCAAFAVNLLMRALRYVPAALLYAINNGGILILLALLNRAVLGERIGKLQWVAIAAAVAALVLMNL